jgi:hypothetical protein
MSDKEKEKNAIKVTIDSQDISDQVAIGQDIKQTQRAERSSTKSDATAGADRSDRDDLIKLRQVLATRFNESELRDLCLDLGVPYADLPGSSKQGKARELIDFFVRRRGIQDLVSAVYQRRPNAKD